MTEGIISATGRTITASDDTGSNEETLHGLLQTDAPISPGNSGGPLVDAAGDVIGMDTAAASAGTAGASLGFAIPSNTVERTAEEIGTHKDLPGLIFGRTPFLGIEVIDSSEVANGSDPFGSPFGFGPVATTPDGTPGVVVAAVDPGSPAATAGILSGDVITAIDGHATPTTTALSKVIDAHKPGDVVSMTVSTQSGTGAVRAAWARHRSTDGWGGRGAGRGPGQDEHRVSARRTAVGLPTPCGQAPLRRAATGRPRARRPGWRSARGRPGAVLTVPAGTGGGRRARRPWSPW